MPFRLSTSIIPFYLGGTSKGFELLRRYLIRHGPGTDMEDLDFEAVNKEIEADEAA